MVEVYVPFLLLLMSWTVDDPQRTMEVQQRLFLGETECISAGEEIARLRADSRPDGREFAWKCVPHERGIEVRRAPDSGR
ncbi:hypothetical protein ACI5KX_08055 [Erythrobacter sp. GH1-10]|uniref:hypothetical protein n=1 Tax=Erythrobacter sp. GH1-10 TaxID=3349334 RepID=UPI003877CC2B